MGGWVAARCCGWVGRGSLLLLEYEVCYLVQCEVVQVVAWCQVSGTLWVPWLFTTAVLLSKRVWNQVYLM